MTITSLFPHRTEVVECQRVPRHRKPYDPVTDILRKHATVVPARNSTKPDTMRAVFPR